MREGAVGAVASWLTNRVTMTRAATLCRRQRRAQVSMVQRALSPRRNRRQAQALRVWVRPLPYLPPSLPRGGVRRW